MKGVRSKEWVEKHTILDWSWWHGVTKKLFGIHFWLVDGYEVRNR